MSSLSCLYGDNAEFVEEMYSRYLQGDKSIGKDWHRIFSSNLEVNKTETCGAQYATKADDSAFDLVNFFRSYGDFFADLNITE